MHQSTMLIFLLSKKMTCNLEIQSSSTITSISLLGAPSSKQIVLRSAFYSILVKEKLSVFKWTYIFMNMK